MRLANPRRATLATLAMVALLLVPAPARGGSTEHFGVTFPEGDRSFADLAEWQVFPDHDPGPYFNPEDAEGPPDCFGSADHETCFVSLGSPETTGILEVTFVDNALTASGDADADLYFFEVGSGQGGVPEPFEAEISEDGSTWISIGEVGGGAGNGIDIDPVADPAAEYRHVRMSSLSGSPTSNTPGADIDAVGAISSVRVGQESPQPGVPADRYQPTLLENLAGVYRVTVDTSRELTVRMRKVVHPSTADVYAGVVAVGETVGPVCYRVGEALLSGTMEYANSRAEQLENGLRQLQGFYRAVSGPTCEESLPSLEGTEITLADDDGLVEIELGGDDGTDARLDRIAPSTDTVDGDDPNEVNLQWLLGLLRPSGWSAFLRQATDRPLFVATEANFADALSMSGVTGTARGLTLQISPTDAGANRAAIDRLRPTELIVVGGTAALPADALPPESDLPQTRVQGPTRFHTSVALSQAYYPDGANRVIVATGENFPDALSGGAIASLRQDPLLLVNTASVPDVVAAELQRLSPEEIIVMGGPAAVTDAVVAELATIAPVERYQGANRYATAAASSQASTPTFAQDEDLVVYLASGDDFRNALTAASTAWVYGGPLLLTSPTFLPDETADELRRLRPDHVVVLSDTFEFDEAVHVAIAELMEEIHGPASSRPPSVE